MRGGDRGRRGEERTAEGAGVNTAGERGEVSAERVNGGMQRTIKERSKQFAIVF